MRRRDCPLRAARDISPWVVVTKLAVVGVLLTPWAPAFAQSDSAVVGGRFDDRSHSPLQVSMARQVLGAIANDSGRPKLYDNTHICTPDVLSLAVGGHPMGVSLSLRDWFSTSGGQVAGFDLYVVNGGSEAIPNHLAMLFFEGTDATHMGTHIDEPVTAVFSTVDSPRLSRIPVHHDPVTEQPRLMRVTVDYIGRTYSIVDAEEGTALIDPAVQDIGDRQSFTLPPGKVGVDVRFADERSLCDGGSPVCGTVLAGGGSGNENGLHMTNAADPNCDDQEWELLCDNPGWEPQDRDDNPIPCVGGNVCSLNRPHFGIALTLYMDTGEDQDGNNERDTADIIALDPPYPPYRCTGELVTVNGLVGDNNGLPNSILSVSFFDCDEDGDIDLLDWGCLQRCFGPPSVRNECPLYDYDQTGEVNLRDYLGFMICWFGDGEDPICSGEIPGPPDRLRDVDLYKLTDLAPGFVLSVLVEGAKSPMDGPLWDPYLRIFQPDGDQLLELATSDDYERLSFDAFTTIVVPQDVSTLYAGISSVANADYDPTDTESISALGPDDAGGYTLTIGVTYPDCVIDDHSGDEHDCYPSRHEPDDTLANADARGDISNFVVTGAIGDGAFAEIGQDIDIYRINLSDELANVRSLTIRTADAAGIGYETVFDLAIALYDSSGNLIAVGDQAPATEVSGYDQSKPQLAANVEGADIGGDGIYYVAILGTDRGLFEVMFDDNTGQYRREAVFPAVPPSLLNFPHGTAVAGTNDSDLRPTVPGRINKPGMRLEGYAAGPGADPADTLQCYRLIILPSTAPLEVIDPPEDDEIASPNGNDSIPDASTTVTAADRLARPAPASRHLGNGPFGGWQGDVDFYAVPVNPGQIIAVNIADAEQPPVTENSIRSYLALLGPDGRVFAEQDYSLERLNEAMSDEISDEFAATVVGTVPLDSEGAVYVMVAIDNGNLLLSENVPFNPLRPGTTLSRRFKTKTWRARQYGIGIAVIDPLLQSEDPPRMFVVPRRGVDDLHTSCYIDSPQDGRAACHPPILELDSVTGSPVAAVDGGQWFSVTRRPSGLAWPGQVASANPIIAYDGAHLFVSVEHCPPSGDPLCTFPRRSFWRIDPDAEPISFTNMDNLLGYGIENTLTGMAELGGMLYALNTTNNTFRWWDKTQNPVASNGGVMQPIPPDPEAEENELIRWDDLDGDIGSDGTRLYAPCTYGGGEHGICVFTPNPGNGAIEYNGKLADPVTNPNFIPGPTLGGIDVAGGAIVTSDMNGPTVQSWEGWGIGDPEIMGTVTAFELPHGFLVERLTIH